MLFGNKKQFDLNYVNFIVYTTLLCPALLNNGLIFELFICCRRVRSTNCAVYLFVYFILSLLPYILLLTNRAISYYSSLPYDGSYQSGLYGCFVYVGYNAFFYLCIWLSACIAFERVLYIWFDTKLYTRWRSCVKIIVMLAITIGSAASLLVYNCQWSTLSLHALRTAFQVFYIGAGIAIYAVATLVVLISLSLRIYDFGLENDSRTKTFLRLLKSHLFIFVLPIAQGICQIPYNTLVATDPPDSSYYQCGISLVAFIIKVLIDSLEYVPYGLTWLLFVCPSRVYMTEYYLHTWSGQHLANIILLLKTYNCRRQHAVLPITSSTNNNHDDP